MRETNNDHIVGQLNQLAIEKSILVVGHQKEALKEHLNGQVDFVEQEEQLGTASTVMQARSLLEDKEGVTLVLNGDHPLFTAETFQKLLKTSGNQSSCHGFDSYYG